MNKTFDLHLNFVCCQKKIKKNKKPSSRGIACEIAS